MSDPVNETATRDPVTGQFAYSQNWDRMCRCGHTLGVHVAGGFDCINRAVGDGRLCVCEKFRPIKSRTQPEANTNA